MKKKKTARRGQPLVGIAILAIGLIAVLVGALVLIRNKNAADRANRGRGGRRADFGG